MNCQQNEIGARWAASFYGQADDRAAASLTGVEIDGHVAALVDYGVFPDPEPFEQLPLEVSRRNLASDYTGVSSKEARLLAKVEDAAAAWSARKSDKQLRDRQVLAVSKAHKQGCSAWNISKAIRRGFDRQRLEQHLNGLSKWTGLTASLPGAYQEWETRSAHE
jgi:hypothetical protein